MEIEEIINRILSSHGEFTRGMILRMINEKIRKAKGFLTMESAARAVAAELGLEITETSPMRYALIRDLVSGLGDVTIVGRVIYINPPRSFIKTNGEEGKMRTLYVADKTGILRVVAWGEKADLLGPSDIGRIFKFSHGYVRRGYYGRLELHIGSRGNVEAAPLGVSKEEFPSIGEFFKIVGRIEKSDRRVNTLGCIVNLFPVASFTRENGSTGKMRRIEIKDQSGRIMVVLWNDKVDDLSDIEMGKILGFFGAKVRENLNGNLELHVDRTVDSVILSFLPSELKERLDVSRKEA